MSRLLGLVVLWFCSFALLAQSPDIKPGVALSPTDRGSLLQQKKQKKQKKTKEENHQKVLDEIKKYYTDSSSGNSCFRWQETGVTCRIYTTAALPLQQPLVKTYFSNEDLWDEIGKLEETTKQFEYYVPQQIVETSQNAFDTGFLTEQQVGGFLEKLDQDFEAKLTEAIDPTLDRLEKNAPLSGIVKADQMKELKQKTLANLDKAKKLVKKFKRPERYRASMTGHGKFMEMHLLPSGWDTHPDIREGKMKNAWYHQGAIQSWIPNKNPVPYWYSEFPENYFFTHYSEFARMKFPELAQQMKALGTPDNCIKGDLDRKKVWDRLLASSQRLTGQEDDKCMPKFYGPLYEVPFVFDRNTLFSTQAATKRDLLTIKLALFFSEQVGALMPEDTFNPWGQSDSVVTDLLERKQGDRKRDLLQFVDDRRVATFPGCQVSGDYYLPLKIGSNEAKGHNYKEFSKENTEGDRHISVHYRYIKGCPRGYLPLDRSVMYLK